MHRLPLATAVPFARVRTYPLADLFAGCGAMSRGFADTGRFKPVFAVESEPRAAATYAANFPKATLVQDPIQQVESFPTADLVIGGPPCQGFSTLNRAGANVASRRLWQEYVRALKAIQPAAFVMENVPQILDSAEYEAFVAAIEGDGFYTLEARVLNVADYGVPQRRLRAFVIGIDKRLGGVPWPAQTHADPDLKDERYKPWRTFNQAVKHLPKQPDGHKWHRDRNVWPESLVRYRAVPPGGNRFDMERELDRQGKGDLVPPCWRKHRNGSYDVFGRLWGGSAGDHDPHRVSQAREGTLSPPDRGSGHHRARGSVAHELSEPSQASRGSADDGHGASDRERRSAAHGATTRRAHRRAAGRGS
ncbi:DNA cytosine methyltransferase [Svornostia abyssi]|uniref:Cytosine-specific methyltransferase n=1 Tax=Svornostia abyssi TaxID=2898438 RepID=A0ABY5PMG7_9ACTN|nr:DNA cytosine methyltransferase [Parviterribacteraceae bacterium J379]